MANPSSLSTSTILTLLSPDRQFDLFKKLRCNFSYIDKDEEVYYVFCTPGTSGLSDKELIESYPRERKRKYIFIDKCADNELIPIYLLDTREKGLYHFPSKSRIKMPHFERGSCQEYLDWKVKRIETIKSQYTSILSPTECIVIEESGFMDEVVVFKGKANKESNIYRILSDLHFYMYDYSHFEIRTVFANNGETPIVFIE